MNDTGDTERYFSFLAFDLKTRIQKIRLGVSLVRNELNEIFTELQARKIPIDQGSQERIAGALEMSEREGKEILI